MHVYKHIHRYTETLTAYYTGQSKKSIDVFGNTIWNHFLLRFFFPVNDTSQGLMCL